MDDTCKSHVPHPCLASRDGLDWDSEGMKERQTDGHTCGNRWPGISAEETTALKKLSVFIIWS